MDTKIKVFAGHNSVTQKFYLSSKFEELKTFPCNMGTILIPDTSGTSKNEIQRG
jgi:hypothetical protein